MTDLFAPVGERQAVTLRPYQDATVEAVERFRDGGGQRALAVLATGLGKTTVFSELARREEGLGGKTLVLAHREELIGQAVERLRSQAGLDAWADIGSDHAPRGASTVVASVAGVGRKGSARLDWFRPTKVVVDEAHHAAADTYMHALRRFGCFEDGGAFLLGVTATPHRMDNRPLHGTESAIFEEVVASYDIVWAVKEGWLCDVKAFRVAAGYSLDGVKKTGGDFNVRQLAELVDTDGENLEAFKHWRELASDRRTIVFCTTVDHARRMANVFQAYDVRAEFVHGGMAKEERSAVMARFKSGKTQVLTNCEVATEGFDCPEIGCVLLLRPTMSWALFVQMVGRGLRTAQGKSDCIVIDVLGTSDGKSLASVPDVFGIPKGYSGEGESMKQTVMALDGLPDFVKARLALRKFDLNSLPGIVQKIDILSELRPPEEVTRNSRLAWMPVGDGRFVLSAGASRDGKETKRQASLASDTLGRWMVAVSSAERPVKTVHVGDDEASAFRAADRIVEETWPGVGALVRHDAAWRSRTTKSEKQLYWLRKFGLAEEEISAMTAGEVNAFLERKFSDRRRAS
ncbi:MAG: DEAD/DEAH box helicase [Fimbriimonadaceae bacterium]|nr:DEAD/DEAH box helicase [Fimbriimonadaceae bacterium]QYK56642.1 MAG: DEAD/DEAH box helicase [Fimbriimonadaceae bacterium]